MIVPSGSRPETKRSLRVVLENAEEAALLYSASDISILAPGEWQSHPFLSRLGPDIFHGDTTPARLRARLADRRFARKPVGALLMHQPFVAGLGNYLRSEILFAARLHPARRAGDLDPAAAGRLSRAMTRLAERAYRTGGETAPKSWVRLGAASVKGGSRPGTGCSTGKSCPVPSAKRRSAASPLTGDVFISVLIASRSPRRERVPTFGGQHRSGRAGLLHPPC